MTIMMRRPHIYTWSVTVGIAGAISLVLLFAARASQREARFMELVRPSCEHTSISNEELHRLVRSEYKPGTSKLEALQWVATLCRDGTRTGERGRFSLTDT